MKCTRDLGVNKGYIFAKSVMNFLNCYGYCGSLICQLRTEIIEGRALVKSERLELVHLKTALGNSSNSFGECDEAA